MSDLTSKLYTTAPDTIWLCVSDEQDDFNEHFHTGNIEDVTWSDDKATEVAIEYHKGTSPITSLVEHVKALLDCREDTERTYEQAYDFTFKSGPHREHWNALAALTNWTPKPEESQ
jgi:hypothetical protein